MLIAKNSSLIRGEESLPIREAMEKHRRREVEPLLERYRLHDHNDLRDLHKRAGQQIHASDLILRVQRANPRIFVEEQLNFPDQWGFYLDVVGRQTYLSGFDKNWLREFSAILVDERNLQKGDELRGWRTVLLRLLSKGALTWPQVHKEFGDAEGVNAYRWQIYSHPFRQNFSEQLIARNLD